MIPAGYIPRRQAYNPAFYEDEDGYAAYAGQHAITQRRNAALLLLADYNLGNLSPEIAAAVARPIAVLSVYNTAVTRESVRKKRPGDVEFIMRHVQHAIEHPVLYMRSEGHDDRVVIISLAADGERALHIVLEAPPPTPIPGRSYGWLQLHAMRLGHRKLRQAEHSGKWTRYGGAS